MKIKLLAICIGLMIGLLFLNSNVLAETYSDDGISADCKITSLKLKPGEIVQVPVTIENILNKTINVEFGQHYAGIAGIPYTTGNTTDGFFQLSPGEVKVAVYSITANENPDGCILQDEQINIIWGENLEPAGNQSEGSLQISIDIQKDVFWNDYGLPILFAVLAISVVLAIVIIKKRSPKVLD